MKNHFQLLLFCFPPVSAFVPQARNVIRTAPATTEATTVLLWAQSREQHKLRREIASRNEQVPNDEQYAVQNSDHLGSRGQVALFIDENDATNGGTTVSESKHGTLQQTMQRLVKPRAYPLFLAEKAAEIAEMTMFDLLHPGRHDHHPLHHDGTATKERIVVLGSGWGAAAFLKTIDSSLYDVTVISPRNYFVFTPMLAGASVGSVEYRSICEPIREINTEAEYLEATATDIDPEKQTITCEAVVCVGNSCDIEEFTVSYDRLVVTVGAQTNTFGIPGVREHCSFLKTIEDARRIRTAIVNCFERANLPGVTEEQRIKDLTFAVIGAGPSGIEFAAELRDFIEQDGPKYYPELLKFVRIKVIEATKTVLAPFEKSLQEEAIKQLQKPVSISNPDVRALIPENFHLTELKLESAVQEVTTDTISFKDGTSVPYGIAIWAAGNGPLALTLQAIEKLGPEQTAQQATARGRLAVDSWMRAVGGEGKILAFGDCSCVMEGPLPATAQVALQQGEFLAQMLNKKFDLSPSRQEEILPPPVKVPAVTSLSLSDRIANFALNNHAYAKPFQFLNLGILAYTGGGSALAQVSAAPNTPPITGTGAFGNMIWKGVYLSKLPSWRNRLLVMNDWWKRQLFGRDITRL